MGVMVKMSNGDVERFEHATMYQSGFGDNVGYLYVQNEDRSEVATFAPGGWSAVWVYPFTKAAKKAAKPESVIDGSAFGRGIRIYLDGQPLGTEGGRA